MESKVYYRKDCKQCNITAKVLSTFFLIPETQVIGVDALDEASCEGGQDSNWNHSNQGEKSEHVVDLEMKSSSHSIVGSSWLTVEDHAGKVHRNFQAIQALCSISPVLYPVRFVTNSLGKKHVHMVHTIAKFLHNHDEISTVPTAHHRSKKVKAYSPTKRYLKSLYRLSKFVLLNAMTGFLGMLVVSIVTSSHGFVTLGQLSKDYREFIWSTHMDQNWAMFSPRPPDVMWWYNFEGTLDNETKVELFRDGGWRTHDPKPFTWDRPDPKTYVDCFKNHRWFKYFENGYNSHASHQTLRLEFGRWLCREYNKVNHGGAMLWKYSIHFMSEKVDTEKMDGTRYILPKQTLWNHVCYEK